MSAKTSYFSKRDLLTGLILFFCTSILMLIAWSFYTGHGNETATKTIAAKTLKLVSGYGHRTVNGLKITALARQQQVIVSAGKQYLDAGQYPVLQTQIVASPALKDLYFFWRTAENNQKLHTAEISSSSNANYVNLSSNSRWKGNITETGIIFYDPIGDPVLIGDMSFHALSPMIALNTLFSEWRYFSGWTQRSINFVNLVKPGTLAYPVPAAITVIVLGSVLYLAYIWIRAITFRPQILVILFLVNWVAIDLLWLRFGFLQAQETYSTYAGKSSEERLVSGEDAEIASIARHLKDKVLPKEPTDIFFVSRKEMEYVDKKMRYFLLPHQAADFKPRYLSRTAWLIDINSKKIKYDIDKQLLHYKKRKPVHAERLHHSSLVSLYRLQK